MKTTYRLGIAAVALSVLSACATPAPAVPLAGPSSVESHPVEIHAPESTPSNVLAAAPAITPVIPSANRIVYVDGSTQKVCQLVGEIDKEFNQPTFNQTETRYGLVGNDLGYSFEHDGKLFFLFGDSMITPTFNGRPNQLKDPPRLPDDNDAIAFTTDQSPDPCIKLSFIQYSNGAFKNPVVLNAQGQPAMALRVDEVPVAGVSAGGKMFVIFATDNYAYPPGPTKG